MMENLQKKLKAERIGQGKHIFLEKKKLLTVKNININTKKNLIKDVYLECDILRIIHHTIQNA